MSGWRINMMKLFTLILAIFLAFAACPGKSSESQQGVAFRTAQNSVELRFPSDWSRNEAAYPYALQCTANSQHMNTGVFQYSRKSLQEGMDPDKVLLLQIDDLVSKRDKMRVIEPMRLVKDQGSERTMIVYEGIKDTSRFYYVFTLVEFPANPDTFLVLVQVSKPGFWKQNKPVLESIAASARVCVK